jgi:cytochrome c-type biogenesis protein
MNEAIYAALWALGLGFQTSISPCPLTSNIAAISFLSRDATSASRCTWAGLSYTLGRVFAYVVIAALLTESVLGSQTMTRFLGKHMQQIIGPLLLLTGIVLLDMLPFSFGGGLGVSERFGKRVRSLGLLGAFALGVLFALAFCPVSAALYFGQLIPLSVERESSLLLPILYGVGTAIPVVVFVLVIAFSADQLGRRFAQAQNLAKWMKWITGGILLALGLYLTIFETLLVAQ